MKMENELKSPRSGTVKTLHARAGQDVEMGAVLAEIE
jgi:biotin carboxyl carrier protein